MLFVVATDCISFGCFAKKGTLVVDAPGMCYCYWMEGTTGWKCFMKQLASMTWNSNGHYGASELDHLAQ